MRGIDMRRIFYGDFDRIETPAFELRKKLCAFVRERGGEEKSVNAKSHSEASLIHPNKLSKVLVILPFPLTFIPRARKWCL
jgi:hypothetical protein